MRSKSQIIFEEMFTRVDRFFDEIDAVAESIRTHDGEARRMMLTRINQVRQNNGWRPITKSEFDELAGTARLSLYHRTMKAK